MDSRNSSTTGPPGLSADPSTMSSSILATSASTLSPTTPISSAFLTSDRSVSLEATTGAANESSESYPVLPPIDHRSSMTHSEAGMFTPRPRLLHSVISVDSDHSDNSSLLSFEESKIKYVPSYYPSEPVDETGLIRSIGRPFNPNHARNLAAPGEEFLLSRRVSQVRLNHIRTMGDVNVPVMNGLVKIIELCALTIGLTGIAFFIYAVVVGTVQTPSEYVHHFLRQNPICKALYVGGIVQPIAVAPYCRYALVNLKHIRGYYLRVPMSLVFPLGVALCSTFQLAGTAEGGAMSKFLKDLMTTYHHASASRNAYARKAWDSIQNKFQCCGYEAAKDWLDAVGDTGDAIEDRSHDTNFSIFRVGPETGTLPESCCTEFPKSCITTSADLKYPSCKAAYLAGNITFGTFFLLFPLVVITMEVLSVVFMRTFYQLIKHELYDERGPLKIMCGSICSLCEMDEESDDEIPEGSSEQDKTNKNQSVKTRGSHKKLKSFKNKVGSTR